VWTSFYIFYLFDNDTRVNYCILKFSSIVVFILSNQYVVCQSRSRWHHESLNKPLALHLLWAYLTLFSFCWGFSDDQKGKKSFLHVVLMKTSCSDWHELVLCLFVIGLSWWILCQLAFVWNEMLTVNCFLEDRKKGILHGTHNRPFQRILAESEGSALRWCHLTQWVLCYSKPN